MKERWFDRSFPRDLATGRLPVLLERLRGTPSRVEEMTSGLSVSALTSRKDGTWSIQENMGHLLDLERLWSGRIDDFVAGLPSLRSADLENGATWRANHNAAPFSEILADFRRARLQLVETLAGLDETVLARSALHPRLKQPMRIVDLAFFVCEHDDHHLSRIQELRDG